MKLAYFNRLTVDYSILIEGHSRKLLLEGLQGNPMEVFAVVNNQEVNHFTSSYCSLKDLATETILTRCESKGNENYQTNHILSWLALELFILDLELGGWKHNSHGQCPKIDSFT